MAFSEPDGSSLSILPPQDAPEKLAGVGGKPVEGSGGEGGGVLFHLIVDRLREL